MTNSQHQPVLLKQAIDALNINPHGVYVDATFGRGGHSQEILKHLAADGKLLVIDQDPTAIAVAQSLFSHDTRVSIKHGSFARLKDFLAELTLVGKIDGILLDLGVSSPQLMDAQRGFSFLHDGPLDMRMNFSAGVSAQSWLAKVSEFELARVLYEYGEERFSRRIARAIVEQRKKNPICSTNQLAEIIRAAHPRWPKNKHPATQSFQAIRILINDELGSLEAVLPQAVTALTQGGRLVVISFHSLEDRIVKRFIANSKEQLIKISKAVKPDLEEIQQNPRARSAVLRVAEKSS